MFLYDFGIFMKHISSSLSCKLMDVTKANVMPLVVGQLYLCHTCGQGCGVGAGVGVRVARSHGNEPGVGVGVGTDQTASTPTPERFL